jgi:hypothetical protein
VHVDMMALTGTIAMSTIVLLWGLWLAQREGASRAWRALPIAVLPAVIVPALAALAVPRLIDVAHGALFLIAGLVSVGTLAHAGRERQEPSAEELPREP